jgi:hypothetical protein
MKDSIIKTLLIVAGALGIIQGLMTIIGESIAICDKHKNIDSNKGYTFEDAMRSKYSCELVRFANDPSGENILNPNFDYGDMDRG